MPIRPIFRLFAAALALAASSLLSSCGGSGDQVQLKILTWNIEYGGKFTDFHQTPNSQIVKAVQLSNADVVSVMEGYNSVEKLAHDLGWKYFDHGMQVVSKYPLYEPQDSQHTYLLVEVTPGKVVALATAHLDSEPYGPYDIANGGTAAAAIDQERQTHFVQLTPHFDVWSQLISAGMPTFAMGDFNVPSHLDWTVAAVNLRPQIKFPVEWPVSKRLLDMGMRDSYREIYPDPLLKPGITWFARRKQYVGHWNPIDDNPPYSDRIDFIYAGGPSVTLNSQIVGDAGGPDVDISLPGDTDTNRLWPSDHRGVVSTFNVIPAAMPTLIAVDQRVIRAGGSLKVSANGDLGQTSVAIVAQGGAAGAAVLQRTVTVPFAQAAFDTTGLAPGNYEALLLNSSGTVKLRSHSFEVLALGAATSATVDTSHSYNGGDPVTVTYANSTAARWDWVALIPDAPFDVTTSSDADIDANTWAWDYAANGHSTGTLVSPAHGQVVLQIPSGADAPPPGSYRVVLFTEDYTVLSQSAPFTIN